MTYNPNARIFIAGLLAEHPNPLTDLLARHPRPGWTSTTLAAPDAGAAEGRVIVPFTLAEGVLHDKVAAFAAATGSPFVAGALADTDALAHLVILRASA